MTKEFTTREEWLLAAVDELNDDVFRPNDLTIPAFRVSVGWPGGRGKKSSVIGQCWNSSTTEDGTAAIFISPKVNSPIEVLAILVHELIHAIDDCHSGHKGAFVKMFRKVGMAGKPTQSGYGDELGRLFIDIEGRLGKYPHAAVRPQPTGGSGEKKQGTRMLKVMCSDEECGYTLRTTRQWIDRGLPTCACGSEMLEV